MQRPAPKRGLLQPLEFTLRAKGPLGLVDRFRTVVTRFGPTPRSMVLRLQRFVELTSDVGLTPTFPITACVLARNPDCIRPFIARGVEFAVHGLYHNDHLLESAERQKSEIAEAVRVFDGLAVPAFGFRAPYLRANAATESAVRSAGLAYHSDTAVALPQKVDGLTNAHHEAYGRALDLYHANDGRRMLCLPRISDGLVRIPVSLPDDEMLVDRLRLDADRHADVWLQMLRLTHDRGDLFTMQLHPERFDESANALAAVLREASVLPGGVWYARLEEIASWWRARDECRLHLAVSQTGDVAVTVTGDPRAGLRVLGGARTEQRSHVRQVALRSNRVPAVGVSPGAPRSLRRLLQAEGYLVVETPHPDECAVFLDANTDPTDEVGLRARISATGEPVVALNAWPDGRQSALAVTGDIDALTIQDFFHRMWENSRRGSDAAGDDPPWRAI